VSEVDRLTGLRDYLRGFVNEREWEQFHTPKNLAMALAGEVGELVAEFQWLTPEQAQSVMQDAAHAARIRAEIGDVMAYLVRMADVLDIDLIDATREKLVDSARRYPVETHRGSVAKATS
jgi:NTP pyrophosphatase (non-canonical NTP hydrolase)